MPFTLQPLTRQQLCDLAESRIPPELQSHATESALPPAFVASRSLAQLAEGKSEFWCSTFLIVRDADSQVVGGCGFKSEPKAGRVEIGYGVSETCRRQCAASAAIKVLLKLAFSNGATEVLAEILPLNVTSAAVVEKLGFRNTGPRVTEDNETLNQWLAASDA
jgi:[ribosomal protein S5]-alanine N-acetyltransferase